MQKGIGNMSPEELSLFLHNLEELLERGVYVSQVKTKPKEEGPKQLPSPLDEKLILGF